MPRTASWLDLFVAWELLEADLHRHYGIDLDGLPDRSWRWLRARIDGLLLDPSTITSRATTRKG